MHANTSVSSAQSCCQWACSVTYHCKEELPAAWHSSETLAKDAVDIISKYARYSFPNLEDTAQNSHRS